MPPRVNFLSVYHVLSPEQWGAGGQIFLFTTEEAETTFVPRLGV